MAQQQKLKLNSKNKSYNFIDSPFYKLKNKKKLSQLLNCELQELKTLCNDENNYTIFETQGKSGKLRTIQSPCKALNAIHTRVASLLVRISTPNYLHSGKKQHSNITNAKVHIRNTSLMTADIQSFFTSTTSKMIFSFFTQIMKCSNDIACLLTKLCTYNNHIPTGSRISMPLAYWANFGMFQELNELSNKHNIAMTVYVDDLTFSGNNINRLFKSTVKKVIKRHGHVMHPSKTKIYHAEQPKLVTGVVISKNKLLVRNEQHLKLSQDLSLWDTIKAEEDASQSLITLKLIGRLNSMGMIEPKFKSKVNSIKNYSNS